MKKAMEKWLHKRQIAFDPNTAKTICDRFGLDGEKADECLGLCYQLESDKITQAEFTGGLCVLTGKEPEEVMGVLKDMKGTRPKMTLDELDKKAIALFIKRHGIEAYESGEIGETLERIEQRAEEYDPVFLSKHPELKGKSITVYHDPLAGEDWAVVNNETGEVVEIFAEEVMGVLKGATASLGLRVVLSPDEYDNPRWGEMATRNYAKSLGWTEKVTGDIAWRNPRNRKQEIRFIGATREPRTITVYNSKGNEREIVSVEKEVMGILKGMEAKAVPEVITPQTPLPTGQYLRVTIKEPDKIARSFWAKVDTRGNIFNIYVPVNKEGRDLSRETPKGIILPKDLISHSLIVKEQIAHIDRTYGVLMLGELKPPTPKELGEP